MLTGSSGNGVKLIAIIHQKNLYFSKAFLTFSISLSYLPCKISFPPKPIRYFVVLPIELATETTMATISGFSLALTAKTITDNGDGIKIRKALRSKDTKKRPK